MRIIKTFFVTEKSPMTGEIFTTVVDDADLRKTVEDIIYGRTLLISILPVDMPEPL